MSIEQRKCPVCGHIGAVPEGGNMLRCMLCNMTDSSSRFDHAHPNLARAGIGGMIVGPDITREDVERLAAAFDCTLVEKSTIDLDRLAYAQMAQAASESKWMPASYVSNDWIADVCDFLREGPK